MSDVNSGEPLRILLYSDDADTRRAVRQAVGEADPVTGQAIDWSEIATHAMLEERTADQRFDMMILDAETDKVGGMAVCRQMKNELFECPPIMVLIARIVDAWLATWSQADKVVQMPIDPFTFPGQVHELLADRAAA